MDALLKSYETLHKNFRCDIPETESDLALFTIYPLYLISIPMTFETELPTNSYRTRIKRTKNNQYSILPIHLKVR